MKIETNIRPEQWEEVISQSHYTNLLQTWAYGEAKREVEGWKVSRFIFEDSGSKGLVQVLEKVKPLGAKIARINRGPILSKNSTPEFREKVYAFLRQSYRLKKGTLLFFAPNIDLETHNHAFLKQIGFRPWEGMWKFSRPWHSSLIDLRLPEEQLLAQLKGHWRRKLKQALSQQMELKISTDYSVLDETLCWYDKLKQMKGYLGPTSHFIRRMYTYLSDKKNMVVLSAYQDDRPVSALLIVQHGNTATYLIGCNEEQGRQLNAHNFLFWCAFKFLKERNCSWLDLGGLDEIETPTITRFKRGMNGFEYRLIGEWR